MKKLEWVNLAQIAQSQNFDADVCVVGAGAAGIYLAIQLAKVGKTVMLLEAGPASCIGPSEVGFDSVFDRMEYPGVIDGRSFGVGGTTSRWGGALVPHTVHDIRRESSHAREWEHIVSVVSRNGVSVLEQLGWFGGEFVDFNEYCQDEIRANLAERGLGVQSALYMPFRKKNFAGLLRRSNWKPGRIRILYNAIANGWTVDRGARENGKVVKLDAISATGSRVSVQSSQFVLAAGAIETARILLEIDTSGSSPVLRRDSATGCYLADHLSTPIGDVRDDDDGKLKSSFGPRFVRSWMRNFRFVELETKSDSPKWFAHFIFEGLGPGFDVMREILQALQSRRLPQVSLPELGKGASGIAKLAFYRYVRSKLYIPPDSIGHVQLDVEQHAVRSNRVVLSEQKDRYGRLVPKVSWGITDRDYSNIEVAARKFLASWPGKLAGLPEILPRVLGIDGEKPHDAYHPVGTCRMGLGPEAVVNHQLRVSNLDNLWVACTGVLPTPGTANPTFTLLCLAHELANELARATHS